MPQSESDRVFAGSIPQLYERYLVPLIFEPCAVDLAARIVARKPARVLEIAAGTGVVTRHLAAALPAGTDIVATDLNQPMLDHAQALGTSRPVQWRQADAQQLPFADASFDVVACQFGVMFFPDKPRAFAEARRVLRPGGALVFSVWDRIGDNEFADVVTDALAGLFPDDPPRFLARTPHGYHDRARIASDIAHAGFPAAPDIETFTARSRAHAPAVPAIAYCQGTPLRSEIEARGAHRLHEATAVAEAALAAAFGGGEVDGKIQALVVTVGRDQAQGGADMKRHAVHRIAVLVATVLAASVAASQSPYVGEVSRVIKALSGEEVDDYLAGKGMGLAKAAELNGYPGPAHVLELADRLELTATQREETQAVFAAMQSEARSLGQRLVEEERALDQGFAARSMTPARLQAATASIASLQGRLRDVHLRAHLAQADILRSDQVARYAALRGYVDAPAQHRHHP